MEQYALYRKMVRVTTNYAEAIQAYVDRKVTQKAGEMETGVVNNSLGSQAIMKDVLLEPQLYGIGYSGTLPTDTRGKWHHPKQRRTDEVYMEWSNNAKAQLDKKSTELRDSGSRMARLAVSSWMNLELFLCPSEIIQPNQESDKAITIERNDVAHGGNLRADIDAISDMESMNGALAASWKLAFEKLYDAEYSFLKEHENKLDANIVELFNIYASVRRFYETQTPLYNPNLQPENVNKPLKNLRVANENVLRISGILRLYPASLRLYLNC
ncbi:hypothetical protein FQN50_006448 [Emmonsiellopsis sp. PD_5]|nr:hypothetical protein FQN50_006448 [Emmonsiellopsis sp. PD_5]